ncbi:MAG: YceI family protein [Ignavibacteriaceae bacterium]|jgi:polyisoprenoid-binding protein YceI|nr:YceI family protein [Ignavibacteriaceae bacterium]MCW9066172.1 YceI family protein [Ignavibacteriaceae bacterium]
MTTWKIDTAHSEINFKVKHLVVSTVRGHFDNFNATIETSKEDFSDAKIRFEADVKSINTNNEQRDTHLKSADFFDAENHPKMIFESTSVKAISDHEMHVKGKLTLRGVTKEITLNVIYNGVVSGFGDVKVAGFEINAKLNRFDYGLKWNTLTEAGGVVVSNEVKIEILAEFNKVNEAVKAA